MAKGKVTVVLADDHHLARHGVRAFLEQEGDFAVIGETGDGLEVVDLVERLEPAVLLLDLVMPGLNGLEVTRQVRQRCPRTRVVILSMHGTEAYVLEALRNGAAGLHRDSSMYGAPPGALAVAHDVPWLTTRGASRSDSRRGARSPAAAGVHLLACSLP